MHPWSPLMVSFNQMIFTIFNRAWVENFSSKSMKKGNKLIICGLGLVHMIIVTKNTGEHFFGAEQNKLNATETTFPPTRLLIDSIKKTSALVNKSSLRYVVLSKHPKGCSIPMWLSVGPSIEVFLQTKSALV